MLRKNPISLLLTSLFISIMDTFSYTNKHLRGLETAVSGLKGLILQVIDERKEATQYIRKIIERLVSFNKMDFALFVRFKHAVKVKYIFTEYDDIEIIDASVKSIDAFNGYSLNLENGDILYLEHLTSDSLVKIYEALTSGTWVMSYGDDNHSDGTYETTFEHLRDMKD